MTHRHLYLMSCIIEKPESKEGLNMRTINGRRYVCVPDECSRVIDVWETGVVTIVKDGLEELE